MNTEIKSVEEDVKEFYAQWCKETKRNGGVLIGASIKELLASFASQFKQPGISEDVEKAAENYANAVYPHKEQTDSHFDNVKNYLSIGFIAGAEWQSQQPIPAVDEDAVKIAKDLAQWSLKYPRDRIYGYNRQPEMDGELIKIEEEAKEWLKNNS